MDLCFWWLNPKKVQILYRKLPLFRTCIAVSLNDLLLKFLTKEDITPPLDSKY